MDIDRSALPDLVGDLLDFDLVDFDLADFVEALLLFLPFTPLMMATVMTAAMSFMFLLFLLSVWRLLGPQKRRRDRKELCRSLSLGHAVSS